MKLFRYRIKVEKECYRRTCEISLSAFLCPSRWRKAGRVRESMVLWGGIKDNLNRANSSINCMMKWSHLIQKSKSISIWFACWTAGSGAKTIGVCWDAWWLVSRGAWLAGRSARHIKNIVFWVTTNTTVTHLHCGILTRWTIVMAVSRILCVTSPCPSGIQGGQQ